MGRINRIGELNQEEIYLNFYFFAILPHYLIVSGIFKKKILSVEHMVTR